jgi:hypothetical protein
MKRKKEFKPSITLEEMKSGKVKLGDAFKWRLSLLEIKRHIKYLKRLSLRHVDFEYLKSQLVPLIHGYILHSPETNHGEYVYRAVPWPEKPIIKTQLSYPPSSKVREFGRANVINEPLFYGSAGCHSTILELSPNAGDRLAISKWRIQKPLHLAPVGYTHRTFKGKAGVERWEEISWATQYAEDPIVQTPENQIVHEFLAREFTKNVPGGKKWEYKISAAFSEYIMKSHAFGVNGSTPIEVEGILYPSVPNQVNADNVAIKPSVVDSCLEFVSVQYVEISRKTEVPEYTMVGLDYAESLSECGDILWQGVFPSSLIAGTDHTADLENGKLVIKNNKGVIVAKGVD